MTRVHTMIRDVLDTWLASEYVTAALESERTSVLIRGAAYIDGLPSRERLRPEIKTLLAAIETELASREPWPPA